ncbi:MAG: hypothetical protein KDB21_03065, partial [Acidimicrobiales bacterium]|nr:hypothetical protein [Acidimicrobiales bacterium]
VETVQRHGGELAAGYVAAREQQGLVLAALATLASTARIVDPVTTTDLWLQPERWCRRLRTRGLSCEPGVRSATGAQLLVVDGRVVHAVRDGRRIDLSEVAIEIAERAAAALGLAFGRLDLSIESDRPVVNGWHPRPLQRASVSQSVVHEVAVALGVLALSPAAPEPRQALFVPDIVANLRRQQA